MILEVNLSVYDRGRMLAEKFINPHDEDIIKFINQGKIKIVETSDKVVRIEFSEEIEGFIMYCFFNYEDAASLREFGEMTDTAILNNRFASTHFVELPKDWQFWAL